VYRISKNSLPVNLILIHDNDRTKIIKTNGISAGKTAGAECPVLSGFIHYSA
jgi:hypothetical protein